MLRAYLAVLFAIISPYSIARPAPGPYAEIDFALISVRIVDGQTGGPFHLYKGDAERSYVAGIIGRPYRILLRNRTGTPVLVVPSVDGVNAITGRNANPDQSGYIVPPYTQITVDGWRKSRREVASFFFTPQDNSYASSTGRPRNVGVIGLAVFRQAPPPENIGLAPEQDASTSSRNSDNAGSAAREYEPAAKATVPAAPSLGTGHGPRERSNVTYQDFKREGTKPFEIVVLEYDTVENLIDRGLVAGAAIRRRPDPFPTQEFVPDPPR